MMKTRLTSIALLLSLMAAPIAVHAQFSTDSTAPITGSADSGTYENNYFLLTGQVDIRQADVRILADTVKVFGSSGRANAAGEVFDDVSRMEALGNFFYITPEQEVKGDQGIYERAKDSFTVTGNVILLQGEDNVVTGDRLIYNLTNNQATVTGNCKGRRCGDRGRVNILIKNTNNRSAS
jgi:lipopolysaccharide export system protein LptA